MEPLVSILIPTNNRPELLLKAVRSALSQSYKNIEVIITDNSSEYNLNKDINSISDNRIFYKKNEFNIGPILNWRRALKLSRGKYCILLPDDDFFINPFYIEDVISVAEANKIDLVITNCILGYPGRCGVGSSGHIGLIKGRVFVDEFWKRYSIPTIANLFSRHRAMQLDAFNSNDILYSDIELWLKMMMDDKNIYCYPLPSIYYLFHGDNIVTTMTQEALVKNSRFIKSALGAAASDDAVRTLANRYINFLSGISNVVSISFVQRVYKEINLENGGYVLFAKVLLLRYFQQLLNVVAISLNWFLQRVL